MGLQGHHREPCGAADEAQHLQPDAADPVGHQHGGENAHDQQRIDQGRTLRALEVAGDDSRHIVGVADLVSECVGQDGRREDADAVGPEVLQEPGHRGEDRGAAVLPVEELTPAAAPVVAAVGSVGEFGQPHLLGILRLAREQAPQLALGIGAAAAAHQPLAAVTHEQAGDHDERSGHDHDAVHPAPGIQRGIQGQDHEAQRRADQRADRLEGEGCQHQLAAVTAGNAFGDHEMRGRIVAAQRHADAEQEEEQPAEARRHGQAGQEDDEDQHLDHEHAAAAVGVGQPAQTPRRRS